MKIVYFGSPAFSAKILESIIVNSQLSIVNYSVVGVVTTPDQPVGRKQVITPSPVAITAAKYRLPIFKPAKLDSDNLAHLKLLKPDIFLVVSYGKIIPKEYLDMPTIGTFNIHFSLLPKYRGALCISEAIKNGDRETGVTLMKMDEQMDHGPIIAQERVTIDIDDNCETLTNKLTQRTISLLNSQLSIVPARPAGGNYPLSLLPQDESLATYTPLKKTRTRASAFIPWPEVQNCLDPKYQMSNTKCQILHDRIRSLNPDPGAWTQIKLTMENGQLKTTDLKIIKTSFSILNCQLSIDLVQLSGKPPVSWRQFLAGHPMESIS